MASVVNDSAVLYTSVVRDEKSKRQQQTVAQTDSQIVKKEDLPKASDTPLTVVNRLDTVLSHTDAGTAQTNKEAEITIKDTGLIVDTTKVATTTVPGDSVSGRHIEQPADTSIKPVVDYGGIRKDSLKKEFPSSAIRKLEEKDLKNSRRLVFVDATSAVADTITMFIPLEKVVPPLQKKDSEIANSVVSKMNKDRALKQNVSKAKKDEVVFAPATSKEKDLTTDLKSVPNKDSAGSASSRQAASSDTVKFTATVTPEKKSLEMPNSNCRNVASDYDVDKLRVKMIEGNNLDAKLNAAKKMFKSKCLTSLQIRALSELFTTDDDKFSFFEASYPFVADTDNFKQLVILLKDKSVIAKFKEMVRM